MLIQSSQRLRTNNNNKKRFHPVFDPFLIYRLTIYPSLPLDTGFNQSSLCVFPLLPFTSDSFDAFTLQMFYFWLTFLQRSSLYKKGTFSDFYAKNWANHKVLRWSIVRCLIEVCLIHLLLINLSVSNFCSATFDRIGTIGLIGYLKAQCDLLNLLQNLLRKSAHNSSFS